MLIHLDRVALSLIWDNIFYFNEFLCICDHFLYLTPFSLHLSIIRDLGRTRQNTQNPTKSVAVLPLKFDFFSSLSLCLLVDIVCVAARKIFKYISPAVCFRHFTLSELLLLHFHFHNFFLWMLQFYLSTFLLRHALSYFSAEFWSFLWFM